jgi:zinc transport system substrate-binding protein
MRNNKLFFVIVGVIFIGVLSYFLNVGIFKRSITQESAKSGYEVAASFYPLYFFSSEIGKDKAEVFNVTPAGIEPHDYDPTPQDIVRIQNSKLLVVNGAGFELWLDKIKGELNNVVMVDTSQDLNLQEGQVEGKDPHIWLSPVLAKSQVDKILQVYIQVDPANRAFYETNAQRLKERLDELNRKFEQGLNSCNQKSFVTSHAAFGYLAREYNLTQVPISGLSPDEEPSPAKLAEITRFARENNVKYIFFETLVSPKLSETIAREVGAQTLVLDPVEGISDEGIKQGETYFTVMESNLKNLQAALECKR